MNINTPLAFTKKHTIFPAEEISRPDYVPYTVISQAKYTNLQNQTATSQNQPFKPNPVLVGRFQPRNSISNVSVNFYAKPDGPTPLSVSRTPTEPSTFLQSNQNSFNEPEISKMFDSPLFYENLLKYNKSLINDIKNEIRKDIFQENRQFFEQMIDTHLSSHISSQVANLKKEVVELVPNLVKSVYCASHKVDDKPDKPAMNEVGNLSMIEQTINQLKQNYITTNVKIINIETQIQSLLRSSGLNLTRLSKDLKLAFPENQFSIEEELSNQRQAVF